MAEANPPRGRRGRGGRNLGAVPRRNLRGHPDPEDDEQNAEDLQQRDQGDEQQQDRDDRDQQDQDDQDQSDSDDHDSQQGQGRDQDRDQDHDQDHDQDRDQDMDQDHEQEQQRGQNRDNFDDIFDDDFHIDADRRAQRQRYEEELNFYRGNARLPDRRERQAPPRERWERHVHFDQPQVPQPQGHRDVPLGHLQGIQLNDPVMQQAFAQFLQAQAAQAAPQVDPPMPPPPQPVPGMAAGRGAQPPIFDLDADRDYLENANRLFDAVNIRAPVVRPIIPPRALAGQNVPVAGADTTRQLQRQNIAAVELAAQQAQLINNLVFRMGQPNPPVDAIMDLRVAAAASTRTAFILKNEARQLSVQLQDAARISDRYQLVATMPDWTGLVDPARPISAKDLQAACKVFDPTDPKSDFGEIWDNLRYYGRDNFYREVHYRQALSILLTGDARQLYQQHRDLGTPFEQSVQALYQAYAKPKSILEDKNALNTISRRANESLAQCVARGEIQIDKQQFIHPVHKWPTVRETMVRELVYNVVVPQTQRHITFLENEAIDTSGQVCPIYRLIREIDKYELEHDLRPKSEMKPTFHAAHTGVFHNTQSGQKRTVAKSVKKDKAAKQDEAVVSANAVDLRSKPFNKNKPRRSNSGSRSNSNNDSTDSKTNGSKGNNQRSRRDQSKPRSNNDSKSGQGQQKSYSKEYKDAKAHENKGPHYKKKKDQGKPSSSGSEQKKPSQKKSSVSSVQPKPFVKAGPLYNPRPGQEECFYAQFGDEHFMVTPMKQAHKKSEN